MKLYAFMQDSRYIDIVNDFKKQVKKIHEQVENEVKDDRIKVDVRTATKDTLEKINRFYDVKAKEYEEQRASIERAYKNKQQRYDDPQAELLERQDFDMKIQVASNDNLEEMLKDETVSLNEYQFNRLQIEYKNRGMKDTDFSHIRTMKHIGKEFLDDPNYQQLAEDEKYLYLTRPNGKHTHIWYATDDRPRPASLDTLFHASRKNFNIDNLKQLEQGASLLEQTAKTADKTRASFNPIMKKEAETFADDLVKSGKPFKVNQYKDVDPRTIQGTPDYTLEDEFKYLKERYHDDTNPLYQIMSNEYSVTKHMAYLRKKHQEHLEAHPDLRKEFEQAEEQTEPEPEPAETN